jgi:hypothetical protein
MTVNRLGDAQQLRQPTTEGPDAKKSEFPHTD